MSRVLMHVNFTDSRDVKIADVNKTLDDEL